MVSTPERFTNNSTISPMMPTPVKKPSVRESLCLVTDILEVKKRTTNCRFGAAKSKRKVIRYVTTPWALKKSKK